MHIIKKFQLNFKSKNDIIVLSVLIFSVITGLIIRLKGLGEWSLALDEYYTVESAQNILKYGVPMWDSGGYYMRGILIKYITAAFLWSGFEAEYGSRLVTVIANMLAIPPLFILAKKVSGKIFAAVMIFVFCFSLWEVEFARFARMYAPFQTIFLWYILFLYNNIIEDNLKSWKLLFILSIISIFIHESGIFLVALNFFPFIWKQRIQLSKIFVSVLILIASLYYLTFDFWNLNLKDVMPSDIIYEGNDFTHQGYLRTPDLLFNFISFQNISGWIYLILVVLGLFILVKIFKQNELNILAKISLSISLVLAFFNQLTLTLIVLILGLLFRWIKISYIQNKWIKNLFAAILLISVYWLAFIFIADSWYLIFPEKNISSFFDIAKKSGLILFNYPYNYFTFLMYYSAIPNFTIVSFLILLTSIILFLYNKFKENEKGYRFISIIVVINILFVIFVNTPILETRYTFHLFPLILLLILLTFKQISKIIFTEKSVSVAIFVLVTSIFLIISEDFDPRHLLNIDSKNINFRIGFRGRLERHYYPRWDVEGVANVVNKNARPGDLIIINEPVFSYYLNRVDYFFEDYRSGRFGAVTTAGGSMERWTNSKLLYTIPSLMNVVEESGHRVWFIARGKVYFNEMPFYDYLQDYLFYTGRDESTWVFLFTLSDQQ